MAITLRKLRSVHYFVKDRVIAKDDFCLRVTQKKEIIFYFFERLKKNIQLQQNNIGREHFQFFYKIVRK